MQWKLRGTDEKSSGHSIGKIGDDTDNEMQDWVSWVVLAAFSAGLKQFMDQMHLSSYEEDQPSLRCPSGDESSFLCMGW